MKLARAISAARSAFKAVYQLPSDYGYWDSITNGWAAVAAGWSAFWIAMREWGGLGYKDLAEAAAANPHAGRGIGLVVDNGAAVPIVSYRKKGDADELAETKALDIINRTGWTDLWTAFVWGIYCGGELFLEKIGPSTGPNSGTARQINILRNEDFVEFRRDSQGEVTHYIFQKKPTGTTEYPAEDVLHIKTFNPGDRDRGLPILVSARRALTMVAEADAWNRGIAKGGGRVPAYFKPVNLADGKTLTKEQVELAQENSDRATLDRQHKNLPQVLSGAFDVVQGAISPKDADWMKGRTVSMAEIAAVIGVPASLLAGEKAGSLTDAGVDSEVEALYKLTIQPKIAMFLSALSDWLCEPGERLDADWDNVAALQEDMDAKYTRYGNAHVAGTITKKEARVSLGWSPEPEPGMEDEAEDPLKALGGISDEDYNSILKMVA